MEDLIRRSDAIAILEDLQSKHLQFCLVPFRIAIEKVQAIPSADRPRGRWVDGDGNPVPIDKYGDVMGSAFCTNCGDWLSASDEYAVRGYFCPNCGARMFAKDTNVPNKKGADDENN